MSVRLRTAPRQYRINKWIQLNKIPSDNSSAVKIVVSEFTQSEILQGTNISIIDPKRGTVFAYTINAQGVLPNSECNELTVEQILEELRRWGFNVVYSPQFELSRAQSEFIRSLLTLGCSHIRPLDVKGIKKTFCVAFNVDKPELAVYRQKLLTNSYLFERHEWEAIRTAGVILLEQQDNFRRFSWNWLDFVAEINDLVTRFAPPCHCQGKCDCK